MEKVVTAQEMKFYDQFTIEKIGIPSLLLMERAAMEVFFSVRSRIHNGTRVLIAAGSGNNGGDALAAGRLFTQTKADVTLWMPGDRKQVSKETARQIEILENLGFSIHDNFPDQEYDIVIDGLFGIGLTREITGRYREAVEAINRLSRQGAFVVAVDIPSGIDTDSGKILGAGVRADLTVTFEYAKAGHFFYPGREYTGRLLIKPIGIAKQAQQEKKTSFVTIHKEQVKGTLPERRSDGNKGSFGKVLLVAGSLDLCGACVLCGKSVLRTGAGMVKIITPECNREILQKALPEAMLYSYKEQPDKEKVEAAIQWTDVIVAGPGLGKGEQALALMDLILNQGEKPLVIDADGLNLIAGQEELKRAAGKYRKNRLVMTPHPGELVRLKEQTMEEYQRNPVKAVQELADTLTCTIVGKDAVTVIASAGQKEIYINQTGNDGLATAGSGDVLAGIIGGLCAQGLSSFQAACTGVFLHGLAGERAAMKKSRYGMMASDVTEEICCLLADNESSRIRG